jgi:spore coat protein CotH
MFESSTLHEVRLSVHPRDLQRLRADYLENAYYPADLVWRNIRVRNVAIRSRGGLATRDATKPGFRVDVDRYTPGQTLAGLRAIVLDNLFQDPSLMREALAMAVHRRLGQPAPRVSFCRLFVNHDYQGVYAIVEELDRTFLDQAFGRGDGYLFEYQWFQPWFGDYPGDDLAVYRPLFEPRTHESASDEELYEPIRAMFAAINAPDETATRGALDRYVDVEQLVTAVAIDTVIGEEDAVAGQHGLNNFYLYRDAGSTRHSFLPWDRDRAFKLMGSSIFDRVYENALTRRALSDADRYDWYLQVLEQTALSIAQGGWLAAEIERIWMVVAASAHADPNKPYSNDEMDEAVSYLREFAAVRPGVVLADVAAARESRLRQGRLSLAAGSPVRPTR